MVNRIKSILITLLLVNPALSCKPSDGTDRTINEPAAAGGWTIMVWLDGDNNLESNALQDLNEMEYGLYIAGQTDSSVVDKVKIIVQVDRNEGYNNSTLYTGENWSDTRRYIIRPDSADSIAWTSQRIDNDMGEVNMGDAAELRDFIEYCHEHFPADNYALILWNHGGGLMKKTASSDEAGTEGTSETTSKNICIDETDGDDALYTGEITDVLTDEHSVRFLGFDACLMGMLEVAYEYRPGVTGKFGADAICFSPASEQGDGWDYVRILTRLGGADSDGDTADPEEDPCYDAVSITANQFAALCAKEYADADGTYSDNLQTQTAVDNTLAVSVKNAMDAFAAAIAHVSGYRDTIEGIRGSGSSTLTMNYFDDTNPYEWVSWPNFDLYDFALRVKAQDMSTGVNDAADDLMSAVSAFILYSYGGSGYKGYTSGAADSAGTTSFMADCNGLSFFFADGTMTYTKDAVTYSCLHGYTLYDISSTGVNYGKIDFCEKGSTNGTVENWYELIMEMYMDTAGLTGSAYWPDPAY